MNQYNPKIHHRRSIRLKGYDYGLEGMYFITICCQNRIHRFGQIENGIMKLNKFGQIAYDEWINTSQIRPNVALHEFVIMPNHIHGIIEIIRPGTSQPRNPDAQCRGELHSPDLHPPELHSPDLISPESHSPELHHPESHSPESYPPESHSPESHSPDLISPESHSPELHSPDLISPELHSPELISSRGVCKTPPRSPSQTIGAIVRGYKSAVTKQLGLIRFSEKLWQRNYYEHIIRNENAYQRIAQYILSNPEKWKEDTFFLNETSG